MTRRKRRQHTPEFKAKVALESIKENKTLTELATEYDILPNQITQWKQELTTNASSIFGKYTNNLGGIKKVAGDEITKLHAKIGKLTMEIELLSKDI